MHLSFILIHQRFFCKAFVYNDRLQPPGAWNFKSIQLVSKANGHISTSVAQMSIDDAPQWAQKAGFGTRIQQPWFVPSKGEYDKLYGNRDRTSSERPMKG